MARRKGWDELVNDNGESTAYRRRLERAGITRAAYENGASLKSARGHKHTPERPQQAQRNPQRYEKYLQSRKPMRVITTDGITTLSGLRKKDRSTVAIHWKAVDKYLGTGDSRALDAFEGVTVGGYKDVPIYELETRLDPIDDYANLGQIDPDDIYEE
jgi:hypothetical protein